MPGFRRSIAKNLYAVALRVIEIERLAYRMVRGARQRYIVTFHMRNPAREVRTRWHEEGGVIEPGFMLVVRFGSRPML